MFLFQPFQIGDQMIFGGDYSNQTDDGRKVQEMYSRDFFVNNTLSANVSKFYAKGEHDQMQNIPADIRFDTGLVVDPIKNDYGIYMLDLKYNEIKQNGDTKQETAEISKYDINSIKSNLERLSTTTQNKPFIIVSHFPLHYQKKR